MARIYTNENFPRDVVVELRGLGHDVLTSQEAGNADRGVPDLDVLLFAAGHQRIVLTLNRRDFFRLPRNSPNHFGIIACTVDPNFSEQAQRIHQALQAENLFNGKLIRINKPAS